MYQVRGDPVIFSRDCDAIVIPAGDSGTIPQGAEGVLTQALGGSYTVYIQGNLFRIAGRDGDAIGRDVVPPPELAEDASDSDVEQLVWDQLHTTFDPEIPIDIVELGLVYRCDLIRLENGQRDVEIDMTLTAPGCGMGEVIAADVRDKIEIIPTVNQCRVELVFDPPWSSQMMSDAAKLQTGML
ncbi:putative FeS assembly SUF system protein SufT [Natronocella acetinitrilica]|uniref:FeS assembly SUF system protein SufT n=1 Tax=Natronocella acetinitrilica TaxID=414046 RepID=A0AAE3G3N5_9GAMM|nr:putative Fe-S cluster assembly protein SufT [Natronocella acetinitrilica]MCP1673783.1 putative FeS assembly SUF system protein SufT [Natronocella acetinitrilica]